ncbi:MAG TPA: hypothetical protein VEC60_09100 [Reyranella sp.]|nr:hypothetical protein [Reyranella sp.]
MSPFRHPQQMQAAAIGISSPQGSNVIPDSRTPAVLIAMADVRRETNDGSFIEF